MIDYKLYIIRHGLTQGNLDGRYIGATDLPLCEEGARQIQKLQSERIYPDVQKVYSSPLQRCLDTAEILYPDSHLQIIPELSEYNFGVFENKVVAELTSSEAFKRWTESGMKEAPDGGESMNDFIKRCDEGFSKVVANMMENHITEAALIVHGGILMNIFAMHAYPQREPIYWQAEPGEGFTALITPPVWLRGQVFEAFDPIPYKKDDDREPSPFEMFDLDDDDDYDDDDDPSFE